MKERQPLRKPLEILNIYMQKSNLDLNFTLYKNWLKADHGLRQNYVNILEQNIVGEKEQNPGLSKVLKWPQKHNSGAPGSSVS